jgi:superfamily II DNA or RNA helicase
MSHHAPVGATRDEVQAWAVGRAIEHYERGGVRGLIQFPTGVGKTRLAGLWGMEMIDRTGKPGLFVVDRRILVGQTIDSWRSLGLSGEIEMASARSHHTLSGSLLRRPDFIVANVDSMYRERLERYRPDSFGWCVVDECHRAFTENHLELINYFKFDYILGLSATPYRMDGSRVYGGGGSLFHDRVAYYDIVTSIRNRHNANLKAWTLPIHVDISNIRTQRGESDLPSHVVESRIIPLIEPLANAVLQETRRLGIAKSVVFMPDIRSTVLMASALKSIGLPFEAVHSTSARYYQSDDERSLIIRSFRDGLPYRDGDRIAGLVSADILTTGWNDESVEAAFLFTATTSIPKFNQMLGRIMRYLPSKLYAHAFGIEWDGRDDICSTLDLLDCDESDIRVRKRALGKVKRCQGASIEDLLKAREEAEEEIKEEEDREERERLRREAARLAEERRKIRRREIAYRRRCREPFAVAESLGDSLRVLGSGEPTEGQKRLLKKYRVRWEGLDRAGAERLVNTILDREMRGLATPAQVHFLKRIGYSDAEARSMSSEKATAILLNLKRRKVSS